MLKEEQYVVCPPTTVTHAKRGGGGAFARRKQSCDSLVDTGLTNRRQVPGERPVQRVHRGFLDSWQQSAPLRWHFLGVNRYPLLRPVTEGRANGVSGT